MFPKDYPNNPPSVQFVSEMWHPNVYDDGKVCISILHSPGDDPLGYEQANERWSPVQTVETIMLSIISMLSSPNDESPANIDAAKQFREAAGVSEEGFAVRAQEPGDVTKLWRWRSRRHSRGERLEGGTKGRSRGGDGGYGNPTTRPRHETATARHD